MKLWQNVASELTQPSHQHTQPGAYMHLQICECVYIIVKQLLILIGTKLFNCIRNDFH